MTEPTDQGPDRFPLTSLSPLDARYAVMREQFPQAFDENELDFERLALALGHEPAARQDRYGLSWPGKEGAVLAMQAPSVATLVPDPSLGVRAGDAVDVMIEGDNLEVLKLLQKAYYGKVKMIFIDPPYNTGGDFIYPDDFREGLASYLRFTGQIDEEGNRTRANAETNGRYHSNWLTMMYPRLSLARHLLAQDGVIFITIDDHEVHNLRLVMDEVFGPENFVASCIWQKVYSPKNSARHFSEDHDYVLVYARRADTWAPNALPRTEEMAEHYRNPDDDPRGPWMSDNLTARNYYGEGTYAVTTPAGRTISGPPAGRYWAVSQDRFMELADDNRIWWGASGDGQPRLKRFLSEVKEGRVPQTLWKYEDVGHTQEAKRELLERVEFESSDSVFETPKPTRLIERMLRLATDAEGGDLVLDFFAGSGATGEAVWKLNAEDGGDRRFILVQLPEPTGYTDHETVADITRARLRSAADALSTDDRQLGFRNYRLDTSNFAAWNGAVGDDTNVEDVLTLFADNVRDDATDESIVAELLLKAGFELTAPVKALQVAGHEVFSVEDGELLIYTAEQLILDVVEQLVEREPALILVLDASFGDDDQLKVNAMQTVRSHNQGAGTDIAIKVV